ncbi:MAG: hypothetical protein GWN71_25625, partial [Gammaproteobacteria bacterium]|nr:hypothetical protein [Gemmatimonadota bacterium]NIU76815.1 hypothetical protein [Gammaproteobacteria bacterium]NIT66289.1 hypothetical protein [Gemmatimonadota bacterium]NIV22849.1 hypothetical protein [Gemmatimonadota bacterium]NIW37609.1 hypothetical protein [Gemmatimonadota bacterium]
AVDGDGEAGRPSSPEEVIEALGSMDHARVARTLEQVDDWREEYVPALCRLLARDPLYERAAAILVEIGDASVPELV